MKIAFMGFDSEERQKVVAAMAPYFREMGLKVYEADYIAVAYNKMAGKFTIMRDRKKVQRWIDYYHVFKHYWHNNFVSSTSIFDAWATARVSVSPWYHEMLFAWAFKRIWYDYLFYIHPTGPVDPVREHELNAVITYSRVPFHVLSGSTEDKIDQIKVTLGRL